MDSHKVKFTVSLANGETFFEGKGIFKEIPRELSPWQKLQNYLIEKQTEITSLSLYTDDGKRFNIPSSGKSPKFVEFSKIEKPLDFNMFRKMAREMDVIPGPKGYEVQDPEISDWYTCIEAIYPAYRLQVWVDETNPNISYFFVIPTNG